MKETLKVYCSIYYIYCVLVLIFCIFHKGHCQLPINISQYHTMGWPDLTQTQDSTCFWLLICSMYLCVYCWVELIQFEGDSKPNSKLKITTDRNNIWVELSQTAKLIYLNFYRITWIDCCCFLFVGFLKMAVISVGIGLQMNFDDILFTIYEFDVRFCIYYELTKLVWNL